MLNKKQYKLLKFIYDYWVEHDQTPTGVEIKSTVEYDPEWQLNVLLGRGYLEKIPGAYRGLSITEAGIKALKAGPDSETSARTRWGSIRRLPEEEA